MPKCVTSADVLSQTTDVDVQPFDVYQIKASNVEALEG